jgi:stringent starvation protein B
MIDAKDSSSTRPYLIRALYEWCTDNGFTPFIAVLVDETVRVPNEYVKDGEIVLNISFDATSALKLGNDFIEFKGRFGGVARDILVPLNRVLAIYARENGQGMAFPMLASSGDAPEDTESSGKKTAVLTSVVTPPEDGGPEAPRPGGGRPALTRVK